MELDIHSSMFSLLSNLDKTVSECVRYHDSDQTLWSFDRFGKVLAREISVKFVGGKNRLDRFKITVILNI